MSAHREDIQRVTLPPTPVGKTYSGRVLKCEFVVAPDFTLGWIVIMAVRTPQEFRGKNLAFSVAMDPDKPESFEKAALTLHRMGVSARDQWEDNIPRQVEGRTLSFRYSPPVEDARSNTVEEERIEIVGCLYDPRTKRGSNGTAGH